MLDHPGDRRPIRARGARGSRPTRRRASTPMLRAGDEATSLARRAPRAAPDARDGPRSSPPRTRRRRWRGIRRGRGWNAKRRERPRRRPAPTRRPERPGSIGPRPRPRGPLRPPPPSHARGPSAAVGPDGERRDVRDAREVWHPAPPGKGRRDHGRCFGRVRRAHGSLARPLAHCCPVWSRCAMEASRGRPRTLALGIWLTTRGALVRASLVLTVARRPRLQSQRPLADARDPDARRAAGARVDGVHLGRRNVAGLRRSAPRAPSRSRARGHRAGSRARRRRRRVQRRSRGRARRRARPRRWEAPRSSRDSPRPRSPAARSTRSRARASPPSSTRWPLPSRSDRWPWRLLEVDREPAGTWRSWRSSCSPSSWPRGPRALLPRGWRELTSIPAALEAVRAGVQSAGPAVLHAARAAVALVAVVAASLLLVHARVSVDALRDDATGDA